METAYRYFKDPTERVEELFSQPQDKELVEWIYLHIRAVPANIFRFDEYCNTVTGKIRALPESHLPLVFILWCKVMCMRLSVDDGNETLNLDTLHTILNSTRDILHHSCSHLMFEDTKFMTELHTYLQSICRKNKARNSILATQLVGEIFILASEYNLHKKKFMKTIKEELIAKAWHPRRVIRLLEAGIEPEDM